MLVPKLRFKREDGTEFPEWEEKTLSELFDISAGGDIDKSNSSKYYSKAYPYAIYANALTNKGLYGYANYFKIEQDCFTVTGLGDVGFAVARHEKFVPIVRLLVCIPKHNENVDCFAEIINNTDILVESTGVPQLTSIQLSKIQVSYPTCLEEQQKIADFLSTVDEVISQSEAELRNLEQQKKAAMQKIFSQEVRFKREDGTEFSDWEDCILSDYCKELKTTIEPKKRPNDSFLEYSMPAFDLDKKPSKVLGNDMNSSRKVINTCCVLINKLNVRKKRIWKVINPDNNSVCSAEFIPVTSDAISLDFLEHLALSERFTSRLLDCSTGTSNSQKRVTPNIVMDMPVSIPHIEEQQKIADFLSAYDEAITYAKQELDKWKELKKGLLQQMFV